MNDTNPYRFSVANNMRKRHSVTLLCDSFGAWKDTSFGLRVVKYELLVFYIKLGGRHQVTLYVQTLKQLNSLQSAHLPAELFSAW